MTRPLDRLTSWATAAQIGLLAVVVASFYFGYAVLTERAALIDIRDGRPITLERIDEIDSLVGRASVAMLVCYVVSTITFVTWFFRAYRNLSSYRRIEHRTGWAIGGWFVPVLNLWRPYQIGGELARRSPEPRLHATPVIVRIWWCAWITALIVSRVANSIERDDTIDAVITADLIWIAFVVFDIVAGLAAIAVVRRVSAAQERIRVG